MSGRKAASFRAGRRETKAQAALVAAYREGMGLAALLLVRGAGAMRIIANANDASALGAAGGEVVARWWCRRAADAGRVATAATARLRRRESQDGMPGVSATGAPHSPDDTAAVSMAAAAAVANAAKRLNVMLYADEEICSRAERIIARVDDEIAVLKRTGEIRSINRSYRSYRIGATARGDKVLPYAHWFNQYRQNLVRQLAAAMRFI